MKKIDFILTALHVPVLVITIYTIVIFAHLRKELKVFSLFIFISCAIQVTSLVMALNRINNMPLLHVYVAFGFLSLAWFYVQILDGFINSHIIWILTGLFLLYTGINSFFVQPLLTFNSNALTVESILIVILTLSTYMLFLNNVVKDKNKHLVQSLNWINSGLFIYHLSSLLIFYFGNFIAKSLPVSMNQHTWLFHSFFMIVMYFCFFMGLWKRPRN